MGVKTKGRIEGMRVTDLQINVYLQDTLVLFAAGISFPVAR